MKIVTGSRSVWLLFISYFFSSALYAQKDEQPSKYSVKENLVSLDVEVLDKSGDMIPGLSKSDFLVEENGKQMPVSNFALSTDKPLSLAVVLDVSTMSTEKLGVCKEFLLIISHKLAHSDELCFYSYDNKRAYLEQDLTADRPLLMRALDNIGVPSKRPPALLVELLSDSPPAGLAIDRALLKLKDAKNAKKALLLISNRFRGVGPATVEHVQQSGCTLLTLAFPHKSTMFVSLGGDEISSRQLMRESGGRRFSADSKDIMRICGQVASSLKNYYSIGYLTEIKSGDKKPRKIQVRVPGRKCKIYFRHTYIPG